MCILILYCVLMTLALLVGHQTCDSQSPGSHRCVVVAAHCWVCDLSHLRDDCQEMGISCEPNDHFVESGTMFLLFTCVLIYTRS